MDSSESDASSQQPRAVMLPDTRTITTLNDHDVLLGRGSGMSHYRGTVSFRALCETKKTAYLSCNTNKLKDYIAKQVLSEIHSRGGRFLARVGEGDEMPEGGVDACEWKEVDRATALEKCKQALRQMKKPPNKERTRGGSYKDKREYQQPAHSKVTESLAALAPAVLSNEVPAYPWMFPSVLASQLCRNIETPAPASVVDPRLALFRQNLLRDLPNLQQRQQQETNASLASLTSTQSLGFPIRQSVAPMPYQSLQTESNVYNRGSRLLEPAATRNQDALSVLSAFSIADRPRFTQEQEDAERLSLTDTERAAILADKFGKMCAIAPCLRKRARRDLDRASIDFLIQQMKLEIARIPLEQKTAMLEARVKAKAEEFSDVRLERFLRCEGMNTELAARRFSNYWQGRFETFGDKFTLPMTLGEAMRDDLTALGKCFYYLLPHKDLSGRQIIYLEPCRHTGDGYTPESLLRSIWYTVEVMAQQSTDIGSGYVCVVWDKGSSVWDFDQKVYRKLMEYEMNAWPVKLVSSHICCTPSYILRIIKPILFAFTDKRTRTRTNLHDVPESQLLKTLSEFGIRREMLPTEMGGTIQLNAYEWMAERRAIELEEL